MTTTGRKSANLNASETMTPSRQLMDYLLGEDGPHIRRALRELEPKAPSSPIDELIESMAEAEHEAHMADIYRRVAERGDLAAGSDGATEETSSQRHFAEGAVPSVMKDCNSVVKFTGTPATSRPAVRLINIYSKRASGLHLQAAARHQSNKKPIGWDVKFSIEWGQDDIVWKLEGRTQGPLAEVLLSTVVEQELAPTLIEWKKPRSDIFDCFALNNRTGNVFQVEIDLGSAAIRAAAIEKAHENPGDTSWQDKMPVVRFEST